jgi:hypothetical protein
MRKVGASVGGVRKWLMGMGFVGSRVGAGRTDLSQLVQLVIELQAAWMLGLLGGMDLSYRMIAASQG